MPNYNTIITPEAGLPCTKDEADAIGERLRQAWEDGEDRFHGFTTSYEDGQLYLEAEESGTPGELPDDVLTQIGGLITRAGLPYLEFGSAFTCSRLVPGSHGGTAFRIYPDGSLVARVEVWPGEQKVTVLHIWHEHGDDITVHADAASAKAALVAYCRDWWSREADANPAMRQTPPEDDETLVAQYFEHVIDEGHEITEKVVQ